MGTYGHVLLNRLEKIRLETTMEHPERMLAIHLAKLNPHGCVGARGIRDAVSIVQCRLTILFFLADVEVLRGRLRDGVRTHH